MSNPIRESLGKTLLQESVVAWLAKGANHYGGKPIIAKKTVISPGSRQKDYPTWLFSDKYDAEEFAQWVDEAQNRKLKANTFKYKGKLAVEVVY